MPDITMGPNLTTTNIEGTSYETFYEKGSENVNIINENGETSSPPGLSKTGKNMSAHMTGKIVGDVFKGYIYGYDNRIFGLPFKYSRLADPLSRVYQSTFEADTSCIAFIKFGVPNINRVLYQKMNVDATSMEQMFSGNMAIANGLRSLFDSEHKVQDRNLISFHEDTKLFMKYASASLSQVYLLLDLPGYFEPDDDSWAIFNDNGFAFYCVKTGQFDESVENEYTTPEILDQINADAKKQRENYQLLGTYGGITAGKDDSVGGVQAWLNNIATGYAEKIQENIANAPIIGNVASIFLKTNRGTMSYYGKIWSNSEKRCSYSLSFKFRTPYGNKYNIFRNIYFPFLLLHTAAIPKQDGRYSYQEPFLVQIDFPGWFRVNCGVITSLSWVKGGDNQLWNVDGLPLEMNVTMQVEDLYPVEIASKSITVLEYNRGLLSFLENLAGLSVSDAASLDISGGWGANIKQALKESDGSIGGKILAYGKAGIRQFTQSMNLSLTRDGDK